MRLDEFLDLVGFSRQRMNVREKLLSTLGAFLGIFSILLSSHWLMDPTVSVLIIPSMGASAVLLFAAPHAPFSQPWNLIVGHTLSAFIGVMCWKWIPNYAVAASLSVGLATGAMYFARCIHPPGGATALAFVIGPEKLHQLGYAYEYAPVLVNATMILLVAILFNGLFKWRRYPAHLHMKQSGVESAGQGYQPINHEDFVFALSHIDTFVDISEEDMLIIYKLATRRHVESVRQR